MLVLLLEVHLARIHGCKLILFLLILWSSAFFLQFIFIFYFVMYSPLKYAERYEYPGWGEALGFMISLSSVIWVPGWS